MAVHYTHTLICETCDFVSIKTGESSTWYDPVIVAERWEHMMVGTQEMLCCPSCVDLRASEGL